MKRYTCIFTSLLRLILCALLSSAAALPTLISLVDPPILPSANGTPTSIGLVPLGTALPFHYQNIVLVFTNLGKSIPQNEVVDTLFGADRIVKDYSDTEPQQGIPYNRFEYRLPQGNVLLAIGGPVGKDITWRQLYRVLQALIQFMVALKPPAGPHYQELNFEIQIRDEGGTIGNGIVWYFQTDSEEVRNGTTSPVLAVSNGTLLQKRAITTPLLAVSDSSLLAFNESSNLTLSLGSDDEIFFPIPGTSLTLNFYYLGLGLPRALVEANLAGALTEAGKYSGGPFQHYMITRNCFFLVTGGATSRVATTVYPVDGHQISWLELFNVLDGLRQFVLGVNEETTHFQTLGYRVLDSIQGKISVGTLSYYDPGPPPVERRAMADGEGSVRPALTQIAKPTNQSFLSVTKEPIPLPVTWPIPETDLTLIFTVAGLPIPHVEILALLAATQLRIAASVAGTPGGPVGTFRLQNESGTLIISFLTYPGEIVTWLELHQTLVGLGLFLNEASRSRAWAFQIDATEKGSIGHGIIAHGPGQALLQRRASGRGYLSKPNSTSLTPENMTTIPRRHPSYAIPGTPITLEFFFIGTSAISPIDLSAMLTSVLRIIEPHVVHEGARAIPEQWAYRERWTNPCFEVVLCPGRRLSWQQLSWAIVGLLHWMTGPGLSNCKNLSFGIVIKDEGEAGIGSVFNYFGTPIAGTKGDNPASPFDIILSDVGIVGKGKLVSGNSVERRAAQSPDPAEEGVLPQGDSASPWLSQPLTQDISARPTNAMLRTVTPFHIPGSPVTITITRLLQTAVPAVSLLDLFRGAHQLVQTEASQRPQEYITNGYSHYEVPYLEKYLAAVAVYSVPGHNITWLELNETMRRLEPMVTRKTTQTQFRQNLLSKGDVDVAEWSTAQDQLDHTTYLPETLAARSVLSSTGTNLTTPIPYPIPDTIITLQIQLLPVTIPASRLNDLFDKVRRALLANVRDHPDEVYNKDVFFYKIKYLDGRELIAIEVSPQVNQHLTWLELSQLVNGLRLFLDGAVGRPFRQAVFFKSYINGVFVAYGSLSYIFPSPTSTLKPRSLPPSNASLLEPLPYPIIGTPITLAITSLLPTPIPIEQVIQFFDLAIDAIRAEIDDRGPHSSVGLMWTYRHDFAPGFEMSIIIRRFIGKLFAWKTLAQALDGLEDFMEGKYRPTESLQALDFDIEIVERGVVASGELSYRNGLSGLGEEAGNSSASNSTSLSFSGFGEEAGNSSLSNPVSTS